MRDNEFHTFGPPGTGKTTWLMEQIKRALKKYPPNKILVASFTRSAARELIMRGVPIPEKNVGTLHALCYRFFSKPKIAEVHIAEFNEKHPEYQLALSGSVDPDDPNSSIDGLVGDNLMSLYQTLRAKMTPKEDWPEEVVQFGIAWQKWCDEKDYMDFTSLIERGIQDMLGPPDGQLVGFFDEAQDFTSLEFALIRNWADYMDKVIFVGDDDQAIYGFKGSDPDAFIGEEIPEENNIYLRKSYRLPSTVVDYSLNWIRQVSDRKEKHFEAHSEGGNVEYSAASFKQPDQIVEHAIDLWQSGKSKSIMILASCSYMLEPVKAYMLANGVPFHNPYRIKRGDWNPIRYKSDKQRTMLRRFLDLFMEVENAEIREQRQTYESGFSPCYACEHRKWEDVEYGKIMSIQPWATLEECGCRMVPAPLWSPEEFRSFMQEMEAKPLLKRGAKKKLSGVDYPKDKLEDGSYSLKFQNIVDCFLSENGIMVGGFCELCNAVWNLDYRKAQSFFNKKKQKSLDYPLSVMERFNMDAIVNDPPITIGTIHSVKGGEADTVFVFPDLSQQAYQGWSFEVDMHDDILRQFYVAMTRTRRDLILCSPATNMAVDWL